MNSKEFKTPLEYPRALKLILPKGQSAFLWGPRKTGKTTYLSEHFPKSQVINLLESDVYLRYSKEPHLFREEIIYQFKERTLKVPVVVDEIQKIPALLDEVHLLIEKYKIPFVLCGSSARKLKRVGANLLGGRAWRYELHPLSFSEIGEKFDLLRALNAGLIPPHYLSTNSEKSLESYVHDYLKEEIQQEALVRNLVAFSRFLDAVAFSNGEMINYSNIGRDCGVDSKTVKEYYQILVDTLLGFLLEPFRRQRKRKIILETPKFYFCDVGLTTYLSRRRIMAAKGPEFGHAFEHFLFMELIAYRSYAEKNIPITYWRTIKGDEVDFVLDDGKIAIEVKGTDKVSGQDLAGIRKFSEEHRPKKKILVCQSPAPRLFDDGTEVLPWKVFLKKLWDGEIF